MHGTSSMIFLNTGWVMTMDDFSVTKNPRTMNFWSDFEAVQGISGVMDVV